MSAWKVLAWLTSVFLATVAHAAPSTAPAAPAPPTRPADPAGRVAALLQEADYAKVRAMARDWRNLPAEEQRRLIVALLDRIPSQDELKLTNYADTTVASRLRARKMPWFGHGLELRQDVFLVGGRCAWAIERLMDVSLPEISADLTPQQAAEARLAACYKVIEAMQIPASATQPATARPSRPAN